MWVQMENHKILWIITQARYPTVLFSDISEEDSGAEGDAILFQWHCGSDVIL